jgi:5,5'-dehydrodivanillate O-demethylase
VVAHYDLRSVLAQDHMAWETQGPIADRTTEQLCYSDRGIAFFRKLSREQIECVQQGLDPMGVVRDPDHLMIDTNIDESTKVEVGDRPVGIVAPTTGR